MVTTSDTQNHERLALGDFGVLATIDPKHVVHQVPVVFTTLGNSLAIPIDTVKAKRSSELHRIQNLVRQPRASLLVDHRAEDWRELWWVRVELAFNTQRSPDRLWAHALGSKYPLYSQSGAIESILIFDIVTLSGWSAT